MRHATSFLLHFRTATLLYKEKEVLEKTTGMQKNNRIERGKKASNFQLLECVFLLFCARTTAKIEIRKSCRSFNVLSEFHFLFHSFLHSVQKISNTTSCLSTRNETILIISQQCEFRSYFMLSGQIVFASSLKMLLLEGQGAVIMFSLIGLKCCLVRRRFASETINVPDISIFP